MWSDTAASTSSGHSSARKCPAATAAPVTRGKWPRQTSSGPRCRADNSPVAPEHQSRDVQRAAQIGAVVLEVVARREPVVLTPCGDDFRALGRTVVRDERAGVEDIQPTAGAAERRVQEVDRIVVAEARGELIAGEECPVVVALREPVVYQPPDLERGEDVEGRHRGDAMRVIQRHPMCDTGAAPRVGFVAGRARGPTTVWVAALPAWPVPDTAYLLVATAEYGPDCTCLREALIFELSLRGNGALSEPLCLVGFFRWPPQQEHAADPIGRDRARCVAGRSGRCCFGRRRDSPVWALCGRAGAAGRRGAG